MSAPAPNLNTGGQVPAPSTGNSPPTNTEPVDIAEQFKQKISEASSTVGLLVTKASEYTNKNQEAVTKIKQLVGLLKEAVEKLQKSHDKYQDISRRIGLINEEAAKNLQAKMDENKKSGDTNCKKKINELLQEFDKFVEQMGGIKKIIEEGAIVDLREMDNYIKQLTTAADNFTKTYQDIDGRLPGSTAESTRTMPQSPSTGNKDARRKRIAKLAKQKSQGILNQQEYDREMAKARQLGGRRRRKTKRKRGGFRYGNSLKTITRKRTISNRSKSRSKSKSKSKSRRSRSRSRRNKSRSRRR